MNNKILLFTTYSLFHLSSCLLGSHKALPILPPRSARVQQNIIEHQRSVEQEKQKEAAFDRLLQRTESDDAKRAALRSPKEEYTQSQTQIPAYVCYEDSASSMPIKKRISGEELSAILQEFNESKRIFDQLQQEKESAEKERLEALDAKYCTYPTPEVVEQPEEIPTVEIQKQSTPFSEFSHRKTLFKWSALIVSAITIFATYHVWKDRIVEILDSFIFGTPDHIEQ